jgi:hypothetical protein
MGQNEHNHSRPEPAQGHEHTIPTPELFSWFEPAAGEHYVAIEQGLVDVLRRVAEHHDQITRIMLRVARVDRLTGRIVFGVRIRDLDSEQ